MDQRWGTSGRTTDVWDLRYWATRYTLTDHSTCAHDRRALQQLALNVHVKHSDLTWPDLTWPDLTWLIKKSSSCSGSNKFRLSVFEWSFRNSSMGSPWRIDPTILRNTSRRSYHRATYRSIREGRIEIINLLIYWTHFIQSWMGSDVSLDTI